MTHYFVCEKCAHTWGAPEARHCENCGSISLTTYKNIGLAEEHSQYILDRRDDLRKDAEQE